MARHERSAGLIAYHARPAADSRAGAQGAAGAGEAGRIGTGGAEDPGSLQYLLLDYGRHWDFPKGHVEPGEDDLAAARRELHEETGLTDPRIVSGFRHEIVYFFRSPKKGLIRKTVVFFLAEVSSRDVVLSHEHVGFEFLPFEQAVRRVTYATAKAVLRAAHNHLTGRTAPPAAPPAALFDSRVQPTE